MRGYIIAEINFDGAAKYYVSKCEKLIFLNSFDDDERKKEVSKIYNIISEAIIKSVSVTMKKENLIKLSGMLKLASIFETDDNTLNVSVSEDIFINACKMSVGTVYLNSDLRYAIESWIERDIAMLEYYCIETDMRVIVDRKCDHDENTLMNASKNIVDCVNCMKKAGN